VVDCDGVAVDDARKGRQPAERDGFPHKRTAMPDNANILRAARGMIEQHAQRAERRAEHRAAESARQGKQDTAAVWLSIAEAIRALRQ
jgi:hypothetical protein